MGGRTGDVRFTIGGFIILTLMAPFQGFSEEFFFRGYIMQTVSSWCKITLVGVLIQIAVFTAVHPYNVIGLIEIAVSALLYALVCLITKGLEAGTALHIVNNMTEIYMVGFGYGSISSEQTVQSVVINLASKIVFFLIINFAHKKLHWFDKVKCDDVTKFNSKHK